MVNSENGLIDIEDFKTNILNNMLKLLNIKFNVKTNNIGKIIDKDDKSWFFYHPIILFTNSEDDLFTNIAKGIKYKKYINYIINLLDTSLFQQYAIFNGRSFLFESKIIFAYEKEFNKNDILSIIKDFHTIPQLLIDNLLYTNNLFTYFGYSNKTNRVIIPIDFVSISSMSYQKLLEFDTIRKIFKPKQARDFIINDFYKIQIVKKVQ
jgi:hypothetical protein